VVPRNEIGGAKRAKGSGLGAPAPGMDLSPRMSYSIQW
jgi:hypothetical protein